MLKLSYTPNWNRMSRSTGYPVVYCPDHPNAWSTGYVYAHRVIMEQVEMGPFKSPPVKLEETSWGTFAGYLQSPSRTGACVHCGTETKEQIPFPPNSLGL